MSRSTQQPVTADDLDHAVRLALATLRQAPPAAWDAQAGTLEWSCWETVEHVSDDLFSYAVQLGPATPSLTDDAPFRYESLRPGGPENAGHADRVAGPEGLLQVLEASAALLSALVRTTGPEVRAHHGYGVSDPEGFAAMGIVEILVHTHDLAEGLGLDWSPPARRPVRPCTRPALPRRPAEHRALAHPAVGDRTRRASRSRAPHHLALERHYQAVSPPGFGPIPGPNRPSRLVPVCARAAADTLWPGMPEAHQARRRGPRRCRRRLDTYRSTSHRARNPGR